jgi:transposase
MIGIDPHKGSHTAAAIDDRERVLGQIRVRASQAQTDELVSWASQWPDRTWAIENAMGLGYLLSQRLVAAGERVVDIQPKMAARVRLLGTGAVNKNDPNDARSVAVAALRAEGPVEVHGEDHTAVMRMWVRRRREVGRSRNRVANRLHALLAELVPGGLSKEISVCQASRLLESVCPQDAVAGARFELAGELVDDLRRLDGQLKEISRRLKTIVAASETSITEVFGVGPVVAAMVLGLTGDVSRFANRDRFAAYNGTAPVEASSANRNIHRLSRRGNRQLNHAIHMIAVTQVRHRNSPGRAYFERKMEEGKTRKMALRALKRRISDVLFATMVADAKERARRGPGGQSGNDSHSSVAGSNPEHRPFGSATPGPTITLQPAPGPIAETPRRPRKRLAACT